MPAQSILQIVSGFKPSVDGMGDFARRLGDALERHSGIRSHFLVYRTPKTAFDPDEIRDEIQPNTLSYPAEATPAAAAGAIAELRSKQGFDCALLHYGPYGYSSIGEPAAFAALIEELARSLPVLVFFHETYASGMPWKRAFWTNSQQRASIVRLLEVAQVSFTSNAKYMRRLETMSRTGRPLVKIPIFSNIGEPSNLRALTDRSRQLVIFGQLVTRIRLYREQRQALEAICQKLKIESVVDVGSGQSPHIPATLAGISVQSKGWMDEDSLSRLMGDSIAGIIGYWPDVWEKSGVLAAYQAHALVPILVELEPRHIPAPSYLPYILPDEILRLSDKENSVSDAVLQKIADASHAYYMQYQSVNRCAEVIAASSAQGVTPAI
jgi:hypothetical protein